MNSGNAHTSNESQGFSGKCLDAEIFRSVFLSATDAEEPQKVTFTKNRHVGNTKKENRCDVFTYFLCVQMFHNKVSTLFFSLV